MTFVKSSICKSGGALTAHLLRKKKTTFADQMKDEIIIDSSKEDEVTEPESIDPVEEREGNVADAVVEVEEEKEQEEEAEKAEEADEEKMEVPSSPRSKLRSLFKVGSINSVSEVVEAQDDGDVENADATERTDDADQDNNCDHVQQGLIEEGRNDEEETARHPPYNHNIEGIVANTDQGVVDNDNQSHQSESSLQVLFRIVTSGLDFSTDYESRNATKRREARQRKSAAKPSLPPPTSNVEVPIENDQNLPKEIVATMSDDVMTHVSELSDLTLTLVADEDAAVDAAGCSYCAPMVSVFEEYE